MTGEDLQSMYFIAGVAIRRDSGFTRNNTEMLTKARAKTIKESTRAQFPLKFRNCPEIRGEESL